MYKKLTYLLNSEFDIALCAHMRYDFWILSAGMERLRVKDMAKIFDLDNVVASLKYSFDIVDKHFTPIVIENGPKDCTFFIQIDALIYSKFNKVKAQNCANKSFMIARLTKYYQIKKYYLVNCWTVQLAPVFAAGS